MLTHGDEAPVFNLHNQNGDNIALTDFRGKKVVLFFYPKDSTPGCTREAVGFSELKEQFSSHNTVIFGISKDSVESHQKFCSKFDLSIHLLSDPEKTVIKSYGVWQEKKNYGKTFMGIVRSTFLIDETGHLIKVWKNVRVNGHVDKVLTEVIDT
tara:strand:+ start:101 stop:562 length:462 start_codon:yes stop_codon:yes gene_type:complete